MAGCRVTTSPLMPSSNILYIYKLPCAQAAVAAHAGHEGMRFEGVNALVVIITMLSLSVSAIRPLRNDYAFRSFYLPKYIHRGRRYGTEIA